MQILGAFLGGNLVNDQLSKITRMIVCQSLCPEDDSVLKSLPRALWIRSVPLMNHDPSVLRLCGSRKYPYPHHGRLFDLHPPPPPRIFCSRGSLMTPLPPGISRSFKRGLRLPFFGNSKWFWYFRTKKVNTNSVSYKNTVESYYSSAV